VPRPFRDRRFVVELGLAEPVDVASVTPAAGLGSPWKYDLVGSSLSTLKRARRNTAQAVNAKHQSNPQPARFMTRST